MVCGYFHFENNKTFSQTNLELQWQTIVWFSLFKTDPLRGTNLLTLSERMTHCLQTLGITVFMIKNNSQTYSVYAVHKIKWKDHLVEYSQFYP